MPSITSDGFFAIPLMSDHVERHAECIKCGCLVKYQETAMDIHRTWHEMNDELIDWAKSVSKLFAQAEGIVVSKQQDTRCEKCDKFMIYDDHREQWVHTHSHAAACKGQVHEWEPGDPIE